MISWNTSAPNGALAIRVRLDDETWSKPLPYVRWDEESRVSLGGHDDSARFDIDILMTSRPFTAIEVDATTKLAAVALATPPLQHPRDGKIEAIELDVPERSQYAGDRGSTLCSPASLAMLLAANGVDIDVTRAADATYDDAYHGTGNWTFNVALAGSFGLRSFVAFLRDLAHARTFLEAGVPLALSITWKKGQLDNPPIEESEGHIVVLRGFDSDGN
ncbi:MAG: C39 family peptidase, partial [Vulcanimicrobiaceae bacterium]